MSKEPTWVELRTTAIDFAKTKQATNPLEVNLLLEYLNHIPGYVSSNEGTWAHIIVGFEEYAKEGARKAAGDGFLKVSFDSYTTALMPGSSVIRGGLTGLNNIVNSSDIYLQATIIIRDGPKVFNKSWYEKAFGKPPLPWANYHPGWTPYKKPESK
jgi:hypothetical protein